jgi:hypothetical protein|tara:strand:- start:4082 stop:4291 length:210 start_codon:yes stop_codon:yes gene_type:complete
MAKTYNTTIQLKMAKLAGFKKRPPKKPKSKTVTQMRNYLQKYADYERELKAFAKAGKERFDLIEKIKKM